MLIDTHAHLTTESFIGRVGEMVERANQAGVGKMISIACDLVDSQNVIDLAAGFKGVYPTAGLHPCYVGEIDDETWEKSLKAMVLRNPVVAIGEIGLDYFHKPPGDFSEAAWRALQAEYFANQLDLADQLCLPVVVHQRESGDDVLHILKDFPKVKAVLHCFTGTIDQACRTLELGHFLSFTGVVTYPKAQVVRKVVEMVPEDRFMLETDSPYLAPMPFRGKRNEPAYVVHTAAKVADVRGISLEECAAMTTRNAEMFFSLGD